MVGKLMKHEMKALFRVTLYLGIGALILGALARLLLEVDRDGVFPMIFAFVAIYMSIGLIFASYIISIAQFAKTLFTGEGYMTFSLPVTPTQLLISKLLSAIILSFFTVAVMIVNCLIFATAMDPDELAYIGELFARLSAYISSEPILVVEYILLLLVSLPSSLLFCYFVCCLGQLFTKGRKGITFAIGFGIVILSSIFYSYAISPWLVRLALVNLHLFVWINILIELVLNTALFIGIRLILIHKLNLIV